MACNTCVHTFMYYYFAQQTLKRRVWWKKYLTIGQLTQFSTVFLVICAWCYRVVVLRTSSTFGNSPESLGSCAGSRSESGGMATVAFAQFVNVNYLYLFGEMFVSAYGGGGVARRKPIEKKGE